MANEKRLIYSTDALEEASKAEFMGFRAEERKKNFLALISAILENCPTVDAAEVVYSEWACVNESDNVYMCTGKNGCGGEIILLEGTPLENNFIYCPYCGAKAQEERKATE